MSELEGVPVAKQAVLGNAIDTVIYHVDDMPEIVWHSWVAALIDATGTILPVPNRRVGGPTFNQPGK